MHIRGIHRLAGVPRTSGAGLVRFALVLGLAWIPATIGHAQGLIRNETPAAWQGSQVDWIRDIAPRNKVDDLIDASTDSLFDIVVNYRSHIYPVDLQFLENVGPHATVQMQFKYLTSVLVAGLSKAEVQIVSQQPTVAFVEKQVPFQASLDVSTEAIRVQAGFYSPNTVQDQNPGFNGSGMHIAIVDTGVDDAHAAFAATPFIGGYDAVTMTAGNPPDPNGHGTHVASIALGQATANHDRGVAPAAGLVDVRVLNAAGVGSWLALATGLQVIYDNRDVWDVGVVNMSLGGGRDNGLGAMSQLVDIGATLGIVMVVAAGNAGPGNLGLPTPAAATHAITVAASADVGTPDRADDVIAGFSNRGPRDDDFDADCIDEQKPDVTAPGVAIGAADAGTANGVAVLSGTSMAAPHVAGLAALILGAYPGIPPLGVKALLQLSAESRGPASEPACTPVWNAEWGWGLVDGYAALSAATATDMTYPNWPGTPGWVSPDIIVRGRPRVGEPITITVRIENAGVATANGVRVGLGVHVSSAATPTFYDIGTRILNVAGGATTLVDFTWTPQFPTHQCLRAEIGYAYDTDQSNNRVQRNVNVAHSPVTFEVKNTVTEGPATIDLVANVFGTANGQPAPWTVTLQPSSVTLAASDPAAVITVELHEPPGAMFGVDQGQVDIEAIARLGTGDVSIGGVTVLDEADGLNDPNSLFVREVTHDIECMAPPSLVNKVLQDTLWIADWDFDPNAEAGWTKVGSLPRLFQHITDNSSCTENPTWAWLFTDESACDPREAYAPQSLVLPPGLDQAIYSPWASLTSTPNAVATIVQYDLFPGNRFDDGRIVLEVAVRQKLLVEQPGMPGQFTEEIGPWGNVGWRSLSAWRWTTRTEDFTSFLAADAVAMQARFRVADWGLGLDCATDTGNGCGPGAGPFLDHVRIGRRVLNGPVIEEGIDSRSQAQDAFATDPVAIFPGEHFIPSTSVFGTAAFSRGGDLGTCGTSPSVITGDSITVRVTDAREAGGIQSLVFYGAITSGPHAGKAPAPYIAVGGGFFAITPDSARNVSGVVAANTWFVDLDDTYFRGGDVLEYVWVATDNAGGVSSLPRGLAGSVPSSVVAARVATGGLFEFSTLPTIQWDPSYLLAIATDPFGDLQPTAGQIANSVRKSCILYYQQCNSRRRSGEINRTSFMHTLDQLGYRGDYDVYDVQGLGNTNNHLGSRCSVQQAAGYSLIIQDSGTRLSATLPDGNELDSEKVDQATWYASWLSGGGTLWFVGSNLVEANATKPLLTGTFAVASVPQTTVRRPEIRGMTSFTFHTGLTASFATDELALAPECLTAVGGYDALSATGTGVETHRYEADGVPGRAAIVMNKSSNWSSIVCGFPWESLSPLQGGTDPAAELAQKILQATLPPGCVEALDPSGVPDPAVVPRVTALHQNVPNPFNPLTQIRFDLAHSSEVGLRVFDVSGRLVRTLVERLMPAGRHTVDWKGDDDRGRPLPSGIYVYRLDAGRYVATRKLVLVK